MNEEQMKIRWKRLTGFIVGVGILMIAVGIIFAVFLINTMHSAALEQMRVETGEYNKRLYNQIDADYQILNTISSVIGQEKLMEKEDFPQILDEANYQNDFLTMFYVDLSGDGVAATIGQGVTDNISCSELNPEVQSVLENALRGKQDISQLFYGNFTNQAVFVYGTPVYSDKKIVGALAASDKVEIFSEILEGEGVLGGYGYVNMINGDGDFIVHSEKDQIGQHLDNIFDAPYFTDGKAAEAKEELKDQNSLDFSFRHGVKRYEAVVVPVGINNWYLLSIGDIHKSSKEVYLLVRGIGIVFGGTLVLVTIIMLYTCLQMKKNCAQLKTIAYYDNLTGVYNRVGFRKAVEIKISEEKKYSIISLNVHDFKFINEIFGKEQADRLLCRIKECIEKNVDQEDIICRENADIFYVFTRENDQELIRERFMHIMDEVTEKADDGHGDYEVLLYCGAASAVEEAITFDEMLTRTNSAQKRAGEIRKNNICFFDCELHQKEVLNNYVETHMNQALKDGEFHLYLQPKIDLATGKTACAEALVRWIKSDGEMIFPDQFIPVFEKNGFCIQLDMYMVEKVCRRMRSWMDQGMRLIPVSINQSKRLIYEKDYIARLEQIIENYQIPAEAITLEILEGLAVENMDEVNNKIEELQKRGFKVSLDDFGSDYSSLNTLSKIKVDELKLDRWFITEAAKSDNHKVRLILEKVVQIAHELNISTVAEGVETEKDRDLIVQLGCDYGQGYYYSRPVKAEEFTEKYCSSEE